MAEQCQHAGVVQVEVLMADAVAHEAAGAFEQARAFEQLVVRRITRARSISSM